MNSQAKSPAKRLNKYRQMPLFMGLGKHLASIMPAWIYTLNWYD